MLLNQKIFLILNFLIVCHALSNSTALNGENTETNNKEKQYNKFIRHIFNKYGSEGIINFEVL